MLARISPSAYPAQITQMKFKFLYSYPSTDLDIKIYSDANPSDFYTYEPGELIWTETSTTGSSGPCWRTYNISDDNVIINELDGEAYIGYHYIQNLNVMTDNTDGLYWYPNRFGTNVQQDYFMRATVFYTTLSPPSSPENVNIEIIADGDSVRVSWNNEGFSYNIYSSDDAYAVFPGDDWTLEGTVNNMGEVTLPNPDVNKKFYCVTAEN